MSLRMTSGVYRGYRDIGWTPEGYGDKEAEGAL